MARPPSIGIEDVERAVETLKRQGKPVNPYQIRKIIGEGSSTKIQWYLDGMQIETDTEGPDPLTKRLVSLLKPLAAELQDEKFLALDQLKLTHKEELQQANAIAEEQTAKVNELESSLSSSHDELSNTQTLLKNSKQRETELANESVALRKDLERLKEIADNFEQKLALAEKRIDHTVIEYRQQIERLQQEHKDRLTSESKRVERLEAENALLSQTKIANTEALARMSADLQANDRRIRESETREKALLAELGQLRTTNDAQKETYESLVKEHAKHLDNIQKEHRAELKSLIESISEKHSVLIEDNQATIAQLIQTLNKERPGKPKAKQHNKDQGDTTK